ncbi:hypothetical protein [Pseudomonas sp. PD9R]|uniref:hypothetical protein n=1 Tax=Pseudomonas sp. PD9R TaxID=2853534 RepID=UPI001C46C717|nr:hypothetical protein [Pseudomonas sp. PD9R]MBV6823565.1 hypothetical protein [Pseudomonas sp. PD9R]
MSNTSDLLPLLIGVFVVATLMESALTTLFQWRLYLEFFNGRAVKTLIMIVVGYAVVRQFNYDLFARIIGMAGGEGNPGFLSKFLSACVLAGGSAAIYQLFKTLGLRPPVESLQEKPAPAAGKAWVSVRIIRKRAVGEIGIHIEEIAAQDVTTPLQPPIAGVIDEHTSIWRRFRGVFFADSMRLPAYGGRTLETAKVYRLIATGVAMQDNLNDPPLPFEYEIYLGRFAERAIVDFVFTV